VSNTNDRVAAWFSGAVAPVMSETTAVSLETDGQIPTELRGRFVKIGPNPVRPPKGNRYLPFLADGMVHGVRLRDGKAEWYRSRWVRSRRASRALSEAAAPGPRHSPVDTVNTHVIGFAGMTLALVEAGCTPVELGFDLETRCYTDLKGTLPAGFSAHPKLDPDTGELHAVAYRPMRRKVDHIVVGTDGLVKRVTPVRMAGMPLLHDIALTKNYILMFDLPVQFSLRSALAGLIYSWNTEHVPRIGVLSRADHSVRWFEVDPFFIVHTVNAYEDGNTIVLDAMRYDHRPGENFGSSPRSHSHPWRWRIDLAGGTVRGEQLDDRYEEFPRINDTLLGKRNRYFYATAWSADLNDNEPCGIVKRDVLTGTVQVRKYPAAEVPGEPVFVARNGATAEDDGWLITYVTDRTRDRRDLVVLDARSPADAPPVAVVHLPVRVPTAFHGSWIPDV
jgi:carotenoid cleavage dioxygenase